MSAPAVSPDEVRDGFAALRVYLNALVESAPDIAHARKVLFDTHVSEGFTPEQALTLCASPVFPGSPA